MAVGAEDPRVVDVLVVANGHVSHGVQHCCHHLRLVGYSPRVVFPRLELHP
jgi:hypothetical protein